MMILAIDAGNSAIKLGIFIDGSLQEIIYCNHPDEIQSHLLKLLPGRVIISDVSGKTQKVYPEGTMEFFRVGKSIQLPFTISYKTPMTLGSDRIAAVAGAWKKYGPADLLIIDAGTCLTYDFIDHNGNYHGGGISPGINIRLKSLNQFTSGLPKIEFNPEYSLMGDTTSASILSGTVGGIVEEVNGMIGNYLHLYPELQIVLCGGFSGFFESKIKQPIFVNPELVLWGLFAISEYQ